MNPSGLLRTLTTAILGLLLTGGLTAVQAQDFSGAPMVTVDQDATPEADETTISGGFNNLSGEVGADGVGRLRIVAGDYTPTDADLNIGDGNSNLNGIDELKIIVDRDGGDNTDQLTIESLNLSGGINLTVESDAGNGFVFVQSGTPDGSGISGISGNLDFALQSGTLTLNESDVLEFQDPVNGTGGNTALRVFRSDGSSISGEAPIYRGNISELEYDADGGNITAGGELGTASLSTADITRVQTLTIADAGGTGSDQKITFGVNSLTVNSLTYTEGDEVDVEGNFTVSSGGVDNAGTLSVTSGGNLDIDGTATGDFSLDTSADVDVEGDLEVADDVRVNSGNDLDVAGTIEIPGTSAPYLVVDGTVNNEDAGSQASAGDLDFTNDHIERNGGVPGALIEVDEGTAVFNEVTATLESDGGGGSDNTFITDAGANASDIDIETLDLNVVGDANNDDDAIRESLDATVSGTTYNVSTVDVNDVNDGGGGAGGTDQTLVDISNNAGGSFTVGGSLNEIDNENDDSTVEITDGMITDQLDNEGTNTSGLVTISGDVTYGFANSTDAIDNSGDGTIDITGTLRIDVGGAGGADVLSNNGNAPGTGVSGGGVLLVTGNSGNTSNFDITTVAGESNELSNVINEVELDIEDASGAATQINAGNVTARAPLTFGVDGVGVGAVEVQNLVVEDDGDSGTNNTIGLASNASTFTVTDDLTVNGETANFTNATGTPALIIEDDVFLNASPAQTTLNLRGIETQIQSSFNRQPDPNAILTTGTSSILDFQSSAGVDSLSAGSKFTINGKVKVDKGEGTLRLVEAVEVAGDLEVAKPSSPGVPNNEFILEENLFLSNTSGGSTNAALITLNGNISTPGEAKIIVDGDGTKTFEQTVTMSEIATLPTLPDLDIRVLGGSGSANSVEVQTDLEFDGNITLRNGGIEINSSSDFSPVGPGAQITRELSSPNPANTQITLANSSNDSFNGAGNSYDLKYTGDRASNIAREFTDDVANLTVAGSSTPQLVEDEAITDTLTVEAGATIADAPGPGGSQSPPYTLTLSGGSVAHSVDGLVDNNTGNPIEVDVTGQDATINGTVDPANPGANASRLEDLTVSASGVTVSDIHQIDGDLEVADGAGLTLGLGEPDDSGITGNAADDRTIAGTVTVSDSLDLATDVEVVSGTGTDDVAVTGSNGALNFASSNLVLTGDGARFNGDGDAAYFSDGGRLVFNNLSGGADQELGTADVAVPNVTVETGVTLFENSGASNDLLANATITSGGNNFRLTGTADLNVANAFDAAAGSSNGGTFIAEGTTINVGNASGTNVSPDLDNFTVDSGGSSADTTVTVQDADSDNDGNDETLEVSGQFTLQSGTLENTTDVELTGNDGGFDEFVFAGGGISTPAGEYIEFDAGAGTGNANTNFTLDLQPDTAAVPRLNVTSNANFDDTDGGVLAIGDELVLQADFDQTSSDGDIFVADEVLISRRQVANNSDVLDREPVFENQYDLEYTGTTSNNIESGPELTTDAQTLRNLTINLNSSTDEVDLTTDEVSGDAVVNATLNVRRGELRFDGSDARQLEMADGALLRRTSAGTVVDQITAVNTYRLEYYGGGAVTADGDEFLGGGTVDSLGVNVTASGTDLLPVADANNAADREVGAFTLAGASTNLLDTNGNAGVLTVNRQTTLISGSLNSGTLDANGDILVEGATLASTTDVEGNTTVRNSGGVTGFVSGNFTTAGDFVFESGNLTSANLTFDGGPTQAFQLANPAVVTNLAIAQQGTDPLPQVDLTGDNLGVSNRITFTNGILDVAEGQFLALSQVGPTNGPFTNTGFGPQGQPTAASTPAAVNRNVSPPNKSHVVGTVQQGILAGTPDPRINPEGRLEWPVGSEDQFRQASITFTNNDPIDNSTNVRLTHVDENPQGSGGLPIENATVDSDGDSTDVVSYPSQYWQVSVTTGISKEQTFDLEFETGTQGEGGFTDQFAQAQQLRLIRRFDGDVDQNDYALQGTPGSYRNALFQEDRDGDGTQEEFVSVRTGSSTGGLVTQGTRFTVGLPGRLPRFTQVPADTTIGENETLSGIFEATSRDVGQDVELALGDLPESVSPDSVTFISPPKGGSVSDTTRGEFTFTPGFGGGDRTLTFTVNATDGEGTEGASFTVTVNNQNRTPAFTQVLPDTTVQDGEELTFTFEASDPDADALTFSLADGPDGASIDSSGTLSWTPSFDQAGSTFDIVASVDDGSTTVTSDTAQVTVETSLAKGDPTGDGSITPADASSALFIFLGKNDPGTDGVDESSPTEAQRFAADFSEDGEVTPFDASLILQEFLGGGAATASAKASSASPASGSVRIEGMNRDGGQASVPVVLSENASGVQSVSIDLEVDPSVASVAGISTDLPEGWIADYAEQEDGTIKVGMAGASPIGGGQIGTIQLKMESDTPAEPEGEYRLNAGSKRAIDVEVAPDQFALNGNYPNPVESSTTIEYTLKKATHVQISVYDALGRQVATLVDEKKSAGRFDVNMDTGTLSSGVYFYRIQAGDFTASKKMTVVR
jgi:hypothetical protein